jgi:hypothetical protein
MKKVLEVIYYIMGLTGFLILLGSVDSTVLTIGEMMLLGFGGLSLMVLSLVAITYNNRK